MCGSTVDIQYPNAEIRQGKKKKEEETTGLKYIILFPALLHRAAINNQQSYKKNIKDHDHTLC